MPPEPRLFLIVSPPERSLGPIKASCTIVGKANNIYGTEVEFASTKELETRLMTAGLPACEIERAILRLEANYPTFSEISQAVAQSLRLVQLSGDVCKRVQQKPFDTASPLSSGPGLIVGPAILPA